MVIFSCLGSWPFFFFGGRRGGGSGSGEVKFPLVDLKTKFFYTRIYSHIEWAVIKCAPLRDEKLLLKSMANNHILIYFWPDLPRITLVLRRTTAGHFFCEIY